jgi:hypothetical protein
MFNMKTHAMYDSDDDDDNTQKCVNCRNVVNVKHFEGTNTKCVLCTRSGVSHRDLKDL